MPKVYLQDFFDSAKNSSEERQQNSLLDDKSDYDNLSTIYVQFREAMNGPKALKFVLTQAQYYLELETPIEALEYLFAKMQQHTEKNSLLLNQTTLDNINDTAQGIFPLTIRNLDLFINYDKSLTETFNRLLALFPEKQKALFNEKPITAIEVIHYLSNGPEEKTEQSTLKDKKEKLLDIIDNKFLEIYTSGSSSQKTFKQLTDLFPNDKSKLEKMKQYKDADILKYLAYGIMLSVKNRNRAQYPQAKLNNDRSISFYIQHFKGDPSTLCENCGENCASNCKEQSDQFEAALNQELAYALLDAQCKSLNFSLAGQKQQILEKIHEEKMDIVEYKLNITPENLDSILKQCHSYAYRNENAILKLCKTFTLKEDAIRLAPIQVLDEKLNILRVAGCQSSELPTVQLLHLLPNYDGIEKPFHWIPEEVGINLFLGQSDVERILNRIYVDQQMQDADDYIYLQGDGTSFLANPAINSPAKIVDMDQDTKDFYLMYGNCSAEELKLCKSLEVNTLYFLNCIRIYCEEKSQTYLKSEDEYYIKQVPMAKNSLVVIAEMIKNEENRIQEKNKITNSPAISFAQLITTHSNLHKKTDSTNTTPDITKSPATNKMKHE